MSAHESIIQDEKTRLDLHGAFVRKTNLSNANLTQANLSKADFTGAILRGADLKDANIFQTILRGADLRDVKNLTVNQLAEAVIDSSTLLPEYISRSKTKSRKKAKG